jgi:RNA polymerase sigma-70 factor (ECF subfamily)
MQLSTSSSAEPAAEPCDEMLMQELVQHCPGALEELYDRYGPILKAVVLRVVHDETEADDLLQEVLLQVWARAENYSPEKGKPLGWLVTLARRRAIDRLRQRRAYQRATDRYEVECKHSRGEPYSDHSVERDIERGDLRTLLDGLMVALPEGQREAINLAFFKGMSQREIAHGTGVPLGTVKTRIELGLRKLTAAILPMRSRMF